MLRVPARKRKHIELFYSLASMRVLMSPFLRSTGDLNGTIKRGFTNMQMGVRESVYQTAASMTTIIRHEM